MPTYYLKGEVTIKLRDLNIYLLLIRLFRAPHPWFFFSFCIFNFTFDHMKPKKTWLENIRNDLSLLDLNENLTFNMTQ
ncbi:hypothetical protein IEQ34_004649 [Dendrobium chrysotoxum]|uniref:Uncharacterized protein n=1 Tax=Dendrobium chrysotoxum TaxID=161865 RepID=A0AAV7HEJ2_DENCH|nr:hypothetical protein IEQ34_004649 [Dendrobium chrysotoxum]